MMWWRCWSSPRLPRTPPDDLASGKHTELGAERLCAGTASTNTYLECLFMAGPDLADSLVLGALLALIGATLTGAILATPVRWTSRSKRSFLWQAAASGLVLGVLVVAMAM
jgi:hypothetical protein